MSYYIYNTKSQTQKRLEMNSITDEIVEFKKRKENKKSYSDTRKFYSSKEWKELREQFLNSMSPCTTLGYHKCKYCFVNLDGEYEKYRNVDHILPVKLFWESRLDIKNLQLLCSLCNKLKLNKLPGGGRKKGHWWQDNFDYNIRMEARSKRAHWRQEWYRRFKEKPEGIFYEDPLYEYRKNENVGLTYGIDDEQETEKYFKNKVPNRKEFLEKYQYVMTWTQYQQKVYNG